MTLYAIPDGTGHYKYLDAMTSETFSIGESSFPPPWLQTASLNQKAALGILEVVETPEPDPTKFIVSGSEIQVIDGVPTIVWNSTAIPTPVPPTQAELAAQAFNELIATGIQIVSRGTPALNGTYAIDINSQAQISGIYAGIVGGAGLPGGAETFNYWDSVGGAHSFDATSFTDFAKAVRDYVYAASQGTPQSQPVSIP